VIAVSAALLATHSGLIPRAYTTAIGEQRSIKLPDGSVVQLNTNSRVELHFSKEARDVRLLAGEALFVVAHDRARPFRVDTGTAIVQAVGTQFNLYRHQDRTTVSVIEGRVQITTAAAPPKMSALAQRSAPPMPIPLAVGEEATVGGDGHIIKRATPDVTRAIAWRERRLVFRDDPLTDVIVEFNRYNSLQLRVEGEDVGRRRFTGVLDADNPEALLKILATEPDLGFDRSGSAVVIRGR
jgi:transmembrane sensor